MTRRLSLLLLPALALLAAVVAAPAPAVPPGGAVENPLGATVALGAPTVVPGGKVTISATGYGPAEHVTIKVDDGAVKRSSGSDVFAEVDAGADGTFTATVDLALARAADAEALASGIHNVRLLSASTGGARSIHVEFTVAPATVSPTPTTPTTTTPAAPGTTPTAPGTAPTPTTTTPGTGPATTPGTTPAPTTPGTGGSATPAPTKARAARVASTALRAEGRRVRVRLAAGTAALRGTLTLGTTSGVRLASAVRTSVAAGARRTVALRLTAAGRARLVEARLLTVVVRVTRSSGASAARRTVTLKVA